MRTATLDSQTLHDLLHKLAIEIQQIFAWRVPYYRAAHRECEEKDGSFVGCYAHLITYLPRVLMNPLRG